MAVIAFTQEMATLGSDVAMGVCEALGLQMVRHEVGDVVAGKMHVKKSLIRKLREGKAGRFERWSADEKTMSIFTAEEIYKLALGGNVLIRGWGATMFLHPVPHIPCVRVAAPMDLRVKRLMARLETDDEELARHEIQVDDHARASRMGEMFNVHWGDSHLYDLTLNTERLSPATCVDLILALLKRPEFQETAESRQVLADLALRAQARGALRADERTAHTDVTVEASKGTVTLRGIVSDDRERAVVEEVVAGVPGAATVANELHTMAGGLYRFPSQLKGYKGP